MPSTGRPHRQIAVLGAGPVGLEAALYARKLGLPVTVYERGRVGEHFHRWGHVRLFSPFGMNTTPLGRAAIRDEDPDHDFPPDHQCTTGHEHLACYLEPLARSELLKESIHADSQVLYAGRRGVLKGDLLGDSRRGRVPFRLLVRDGRGRERTDEADVVLDCTGTYGQHRWLGDGGIPALGEIAAEPTIAYGLEDILGDHRATYAGRNVLVVGGGYSAATSVSSLATLAEHYLDTWAVWLARAQSTQPLIRIANDPLRERDRLAVRANTLATRGDGNVEFHNQTLVEAVEWLGDGRGFRVTARCAGKPRVWEVDRLIANVGYTPDAGLYRELQVHECYASLGPMGLAAALLTSGSADCLQVPSHGPESLRNPEPDLYILGAKSYGRNSNFLLKNGFAQVREAFTLITGKPDLDLYKAAR